MTWFDDQFDSGEAQQIKDYVEDRLREGVDVVNADQISNAIRFPDPSDPSAVQTDMDELYNQFGAGVVVLRAGSYSWNQQVEIPEGIILLGMGWRRGTEGTVIDTSGAPDPAILHAGRLVSQIAFYGNGGGGGTAMRVITFTRNSSSQEPYRSNSRIQDCIFDEYGGTAVQIEDFDVDVVRNRFTFCQTAVGVGELQNNIPSSINLESNWIYWSAGAEAGWITSPGYGYDLRYGNDIKIEEGNVNKCDTGINIQGDGSAGYNVRGVNITGNTHVESNYSKGIHVHGTTSNGQRVYIDGVRVGGSDTEAENSDGIHFENSRDSHVRNADIDLRSTGTRGFVHDRYAIASTVDCSYVRGASAGLHNDGDDLRIMEGVKVVNGKTQGTYVNRELVNGLGVNDGDPGAGGQWNGYGEDGITVRDTTNGATYQYANGAWVQLA